MPRDRDNFRKRVNVPNCSAFSAKRAGFFGPALANPTVCNGAMRVIVRIFTALSAPMRKPACVDSVRQQLRFPEYTKRLRDDRDVHNFHDLAPHVYAQADCDRILIADKLFPNVVAKRGQTCRRRWFESEIRLYARVTTSLTSRADLNDPRALTFRLRMNLFATHCLDDG